MRIIDCFNTGRPVFSFEFFPTRTPEAAERLYATIADLARLNPSFVSVTYGAGGSTRRRTVELVERIKNEIGIEAMAHLTCVGHTADEIAGILDHLKAAGIDNVLALRGDPPRGQTEFVQPEGGFAYAQELVRFIRTNYDFCLGGAGYPEGHVESPDMESDLIRLKEKVDSGIEFIITQLFFRSADYFSFVQRARKIGISVPILPGIIPVTSAKQLGPEGICARCGAGVPEGLRESVLAVGEDEQAIVQIGIDWATKQSRELLAGGAPGIHFYTLNQSHSARTVFENLQKPNDITQRR